MNFIFVHANFQTNHHDANGKLDIPTPLVPNAKEVIDLTGNIYEILTSRISPPIAVKTLIPNETVDSPPKEVFDQNGNVYGLVSSSVDPLLNGNVVEDENKEHLKRKLEEEERDEGGARSPKTGIEEGEEGDDKDGDDNGTLEI